MHAHKFKVNVEPGDSLAIRLPDDFPRGPAEVIVFAEARTARGGAPVPGRYGSADCLRDSWPGKDSRLRG